VEKESAEHYWGAGGAREVGSGGKANLIGLKILIGHTFI
jgi:hypothetical protein